MKKLFKIFITLILLTASIICFCSLLVGLYFSFVPQNRDLTLQSEPVAVQILIEYLKNDKIFTELNPENIYAYEFDLNNDGVTEVLGYVHENYYCISENCTFFVLQKHDDKFVNIAMMRVNSQSKMSVKRRMTNGYRDIEFKFPGGKHTVKYLNGWFRWVSLPLELK